MYIKRLEIVGFKSFPERVTLSLSPKIAAVVGPNGCGKSNIIDAIRWVMGEQSAKTLRGRQMDDVLFGGSEKRPPAGLAEVTLTLASDESPNGIGTETSVSRRLHRSGDREYLINHYPARLKDVVRFFADHGLGQRSYGIIEQGRIGWLVDARPEERRQFLDEAAGITGYKQQKREAERKMEAAAANLAQLQAIRAEAKKQLDRLNKAATKALRWQSWREELRELDLILEARSLVEKRAKYHELSTQVAAKRRKLISLLAEVETGELALDKAKPHLAAAASAISERSSKWHKLLSSQDRFKQELKNLVSQLERCRIQEEQESQELNRLYQEKRNKESKEASLTAELKSFKNTEAEAFERFQNLQKELGEKSKILQEAQKKAENTGQAQRRAEREIADLKTKLAGAKSLLQHHQERLSQGKHKLAEALADLAPARKATLELATQNHAAQENFKDLESQVINLTKEYQTVTGKRQHLLTQVQEKEKALATITARQKALKEWRARGDYFSGSLKKLLADKDHDGLIGPVAEHLNVPDGYEEAVEAALGDKVAWILAKNRPAALKALAQLKKTDGGPGAFICQSDLNNSDILKTLIGDYLLVENIPPEGAIEQPLLSQDGCYYGNGALIGGKASGAKADSGLFSRLKEIESLELEVAERENSLAIMKNELTSLDEELQRAGQKLRQAEITQKENAIQNNKLERESLLAQQKLAEKERHHERLATELTRIQSQANQEEATLISGQENLNKAEKNSIEITKQLEFQQKEAQELNNNLEILRTETTRAQQKANEATTNAKNASIELESLKTWQGELAKTIARRTQIAASLAREMSDLRQQLASLEEKLKLLPTEIKEAEESLARARQNINELNTQQSEREAALRGLRRLREELGGALAAREEEVYSLKFAVEKIEDELARQWQVVMPDPLTPSPKEETHDPAEFQLGEEIRRSPSLLEPLDATHWADKNLPPDALQQRETLRLRLSTLGDVSLEAISEAEELQREYDHYQMQWEDLNQALADLKESLSKLTQTCQTLFQDTFKSADEKFREVFPQLFEGGSAWLALTDPKDPLESGVEIQVHPPGKKLSVMSLLSGGEKALTALALIFALYLIKPSPFCLLDEIDAPLDEANVERFKRLLKNLSQTSQIIMITHNRRTMQISQALYGVTMETPGVSRLVQVNL